MMRFSRLSGRLPAFGKESLPSCFGTRLKERTAVSIVVLVLVLTGAYAFDDRLFLLLAAIVRAFAGTWERIRSLPNWQIFLLFAPALLLDTTRYYLTNFAVLFLRVFRDPDYKKSPQLFDDPQNAPLVSVVVPVFNQAHFLRHTIDTILESSYPNLEVIIVDDCSTDETAEICREYARQDKIRFVSLSVNSGKPAALNAGFRLSHGSIIVHVDGDAVVWREAIAELVKPLRDERVGAVSGNLRALNDFESFWTGFQSLEYALTIDLHRRFLASVNLLEIVSGAFGAYRRSILEAVQGADPETGEDLDLTLKVRKMGWRIAFAPRAMALTEVPAKTARLWKQRIFWDRCYIRINLRKHGELFQW